MKRLPLIIAIILCLSGQAWPCDGDLCKAPIHLARMGYYTGAGGAASGYCGGTTLFCSTFEATTSWDAANGTSDCDGYDTDGDYCDGDTTTYVIGAKSFGIRGNYTFYVEEALSSVDQTEFYVEWWEYFNNLSASGFSIRFTDSGGNQVLSMKFDSDKSVLFAVNNNTITLTDTAHIPTDDAWHHYGIHFKAETGSDDGVVQFWTNDAATEGFAGTDIILNITNADTGAFAADVVRLRGVGAGNTQYYDNVRVKTGAPSWPTS